MGASNLCPLPELTAPAGSFHKLKTAVAYGANAVYLAGPRFGLRAAGENFTREEMILGVEYAHSQGVRVFVTLNGLLHDRDLQDLPPMVRFLEKIGVDAVIVSDLGVMETVREHSRLPIHLSTQASCLNSYGARVWKELGVHRVILGRESSIAEAQEIRRKAGLEVEMFVHGSLCSSFSGQCVISNFTRGRDSNRGGCAHSCRHIYTVGSGKKKAQASFMSSKDLEGLSVLEEFIRANIDSLKIEGRMKSAHFLAVTTKVYREALNFYGKRGNFQGFHWDYWHGELAKLPSRSRTEASLLTPADGESIHDESQDQQGPSYGGLGIVLESHGDCLVVEGRGSASLGEVVELVPFEGPSVAFPLDFIRSFDDTPLETTRPGTVVKIPPVEGARPMNILRTLIR